MRGPANVRDLGGLPLAGGGVTRPGVLLRGDALYDGDDPPAHVTWPPATVVDLRSARERTRSPYGWPAGTHVVQLELYDAGDLEVMPRDSGLVDIYHRIVDEAGPGIAALVDLLGSSERIGATLVHCAAGKDRTGVSVAALLLLAGVTEESVIADYRRTEEHMEDVLGRLTARGALAADSWAPEWVSAPEVAIRVLVDRVTTAPGGPGGWFVGHGASDTSIEGFRARFRDAAAS